MITLPGRLLPGDRVRIVAPASPFDRERFDRAVAIFRDLGFQPVWRDDVFAGEGYLAGSDERRAAELTEAFADPETRGVVCARGGYGTPRLLERLDFAALVRTPKVLLGFSDVTALLLAFHRAGMVTFHGPNATGRLAEVGLDRDEKAVLMACVGSAAPAGVVATGRTVSAGTCEGPLVGGNLAMVTSILGTPFSPDYTGAILFLEDVGEKAFRLDRMLTQLKLAGVLGRVAGIALGRFSGCANPADASVTADDVVERLCKEAGKPVLAGLPFGHDGENRTLPIGVRARLEAKGDGTGSLSLLEAAVR